MMPKILSFLGIVALLIIVSTLAIAVPLTALAWSALIIAATLGERFFFPPSSHQFQISSLLFGLSIPLIPIFGSPSLLFLALVYLLLRVKLHGAVLIQLSNFRYAPFLVVPLAWTVGYLALHPIQGDLAAILIESDVGLLQRITDLHSYLAWSPPRSYQSFVVAIRWILFFTLLLGLFKIESESFKQIFIGVLTGFILALAYGTVQFLQADGIITTGLTVYQVPAFWRAQGRFGATFTDPNALGVFTFLMLGLLLSHFSTAILRTKFLILALCLAALCIAGLAGSRTVFLGVLVLALVSILRSRSRLGVGILAVLATAFAGWNLFTFFFPEHLSALQSTLPRASGRVVSAMMIANFESSIESRTLFFRLAWAVWVDSPVIGIGLGRFQEVVPYYAKELGFGTGAWSDNPNSLYLGMLAETGLVGILLLFLSLLNFRFRAELGSQARVRENLCIAFLILLAIGPHLDFDEVAVLFGLIASQTFTARRITASASEAPLILPAGRPAYVAGALLALFFIVAVLSAIKSSSWGLYSWEMTPHGVARWTRSAAQVELKCQAQPQSESFATLRVHAVNPRGEAAPLVLKTRSQLGEQLSFNLLGGEEVQARFACRAQNSPSLEGLDTIRVRLDIENPFVAIHYGFASDPRVLGVQVIEW